MLELTDLPAEIRLLIFSFTEPRDIGRLLQVNSQFRKDILTEKMVKIYFPPFTLDIRPSSVSLKEFFTELLPIDQKIRDRIRSIPDRIEQITQLREISSSLWEQKVGTMKYSLSSSSSSDEEDQISNESMDPVDSWNFDVKKLKKNLILATIRDVIPRKKTSDEEDQISNESMDPVDSWNFDVKKLKKNLILATIRDVIPRKKKFLVQWIIEIYWGPKKVRKLFPGPYIMSNVFLRFMEPVFSYLTFEILSYFRSIGDRTCVIDHHTYEVMLEKGSLDLISQICEQMPDFFDPRFLELCLNYPSEKTNKICPEKLDFIFRLDLNNRQIEHLESFLNDLDPNILKLHLKYQTIDIKKINNQYILSHLFFLNKRKVQYEFKNLELLIKAGMRFSIDEVPKIYFTYHPESESIQQVFELLIKHGFITPKQLEDAKSLREKNIKSSTTDQNIMVNRMMFSAIIESKNKDSSTSSSIESDLTNKMSNVEKKIKRLLYFDDPRDPWYKNRSIFDL